MTQIVLTHVGSDVPDYTVYTIKQLQYSNPDKTIVLIARAESILKFYQKYGNAFNLYNQSFKVFPIECVEAGKGEADKLLEEFRKHSWYKVWGKPNTTYPSPDNFVQGTSERLFLLNAYLQVTGEKGVWHIENDNLIYGDFDKIKVSDERINCCYMNEKHTVWNVVYIPNPYVFNEAMTWYLDVIKQGNDAVCRKYGIEMAHEMTIMANYDKLAFFPSIPRKELSINGWYVDPASYGQFVAGTNNGHPPGFLDKVNHDIGKAYAQYWTGFLFEDKIPHILDTHGELHKLFNLHMHNKTKIQDFITYG